MAFNDQYRGALPKTNAFISYSYEDRKFGAQAKDVLSEIGVNAFLAHDDLDISDEWRARIIEELQRCEIFLPLLSVNFMASKWAPQEVGYIISRSDAVITPVSLDGTKPFGFISHIQSRNISQGAITSKLLVEPLIRRMPRKILPSVIQSAADARGFRSAEARVAPLLEHFGIFTPDEAQAFASASVKNDQIWSASRCRNEYLPLFLHHQSSNIDPNTLRALSHQIEKGERYRES